MVRKHYLGKSEEQYTANMSDIIEMVDNILNALRKGKKAEITRIAIVDIDERRRVLHNYTMKSNNTLKGRFES